MLETHEIGRILDPSLYIGRCVSQVEEFINETANPVIAECSGSFCGTELKV